MAVQIDFLANVSKFLRGTDDASSALDDVAGSLDDLAADAQRKGDATGSNLAAGVLDGVGDAERAIAGVGTALDDASHTSAGNTLGGDLADGVQDGTQKAERALDGVEAKFRDLATASQRESTSAGTSISKSVRKGTDEASEGVDTMKENTGANLKEVAASFDGTWAGIAGGAQGLVAEIAEGFGPVGLLAGAIGAGAIGLIISGIDGAQQKTDEYKGHVADLASEFMDAGGDARRSLDSTKSKIQEMATATDGVKLKEVYDDAKAAGADYRKIVEAIASSDPRDLAKAQKAVEELAEAHAQTDRNATHYGDNMPVVQGKASKAAQTLSKDLKDAKQMADDAAEAQELAAKAGLTEFGLKQKAIEQVSGAYQDAAGDVDAYIDKESGLFDVKKYLTAMEKRQEALQNYARTLQESKISPEARAYIEGLGEDQAAAMMAGYKSASPAQRKELDQIWTTAGRSNAHNYGEALGDELRDKTVQGPGIRPPSKAHYLAMVREAQQEAQQYLRDHPLQAGAIGYNVNGKPMY